MVKEAVKSLVLLILAVGAVQAQTCLLYTSDAADE